MGRVEARSHLRWKKWHEKKHRAYLEGSGYIILVAFTLRVHEWAVMRRKQESVFFSPAVVVFYTLHVHSKLSGNIFYRCDLAYPELVQPNYLGVYVLFVGTEKGQG